MKLLAIDLLKEELEKAREKEYNIIIIDNLETAIKELEQLSIKDNCSTCLYNGETKLLSDEEYLSVFEKCSRCSNYYTSNYVKELEC